MGKYSSRVRIKTPPKSDGPHVIWRGIGCLMMLIVPFISYAAGYETINLALKNNWQVPYQLLGTPQFPDFVYRSRGLMTLLSPVAATSNFYAYVVAGIFYMILIGGVISVAYAVAYRFMGPSRYGPLDVPHPNVKVKRYKR